MGPWKACDLRGVYPAEVSPDLVREIGRRVVSLLPRRPRVLVAGDFRLSTPVLKAAVIDGLLDAGADVLDAGQLATPVAYFAHQHFHTDAALIVTASHNPGDHNGLKLMLGKLPPTEVDFHRLRQPANIRSAAKGTCRQVDAVAPYHEWIVKRWSRMRSQRPLRVVLDAGNGAWSRTAPQIFESLGLHVIRLFCEPDGSFPNRPPDCARAAHLAALSRAVRENSADLGIAWDGDGDRVAFVDETGSIVPTDAISVILLQHWLEGRTGEAVVYDIKLSRVVPQTILKMGGIPILERSGHSFLKRTIVERRALLGCELSGHYFYRELAGGDDGLFSALHLSDLVQRHGALGAQVQSLPRIFITPDLRLNADGQDPESLRRRLRGALPRSHEIAVDGIRLETDTGSVLLRQSVTEPIITIRIEGSSEQELGRLVERCLVIFPEFEQAITTQLREAEKL